MKSVVFDTNVLLDIFVFNDFRAIHLKQALIDQQIDALASPKTIEEFADVISRPLFCLEQDVQEKIMSQWRSIARVLNDETLLNAPWQCQDPDDQVFLNLAYTAKACLLISKDNEVLKLANSAIKEDLVITSDYNAIAQ
ncbi:putative toxin-antitoxin system toxin component, PIN family [Polynucleobacter wuianus]|uniref:Putative toxin-antitoxin system toxin component, PIN family n=1 Tax=Polynucleobacter wuianus TaxID=1743168 RepID=A0A191UFU3_9BURK|nr:MULTISPECIES: putative toxin-antitoxin system toxin component, PIN family [Polynucleobacter]ANI99822.1 putative toxin-antitoxin system toxin component, PIN family [Polynucleobacter wuianus]MBU3552638.1 putative toxin-antitoxin system toxin component, PIN family [Polynucleobacter sp. MWH-Post4-6-1]